MSQDVFDKNLKKKKSTQNLRSHQLKVSYYKKNFTSCSLVNLWIGFELKSKASLQFFVRLVLLTIRNIAHYVYIMKLFKHYEYIQISVRHFINIKFVDKMRMGKRFVAFNLK